MSSERDVINAMNFYRETGLCFVKDKQSHFLDVSRPFIEASGCHEEEELIGHDDYHFFPSNFSDNYIRCDQYALHQGLWTGLDLFQSDKFPLNTVMTTKLPFSNLQGKLSGIFVIFFKVNIPVFIVKDLLYTKKRNTFKELNSFVRIESSLSKREQECLYYLLRGHTAKSIGNQLNISSKTVEYHIRKLKEKLFCYNKSQLIEKSIALGLLNCIPDLWYQQSCSFKFIERQRIINFPLNDLN